MFVELWHMFHDELDLDGNGRLDADELLRALDMAGMSISLHQIKYPLQDHVYRYPAVAVYASRVHNIPLVLTSFTCHQFPGVQGLPVADAPPSVAFRDIQVL